MDVFRDAHPGPSSESADATCDDFRRRLERDSRSTPNFVIVLAYAEGSLVGFVFGYSLQADSTWWDGLSPAPPDVFLLETGRRTAVLAEIAVRQAWQRSGVGRSLQAAFLAGRSETRATLVCEPDAHHVQRIYEGWGWQRVGNLPGRREDFHAEYVSFVRLLRNGTRRTGAGPSRGVPA